jgi:hypothetical protein
MSQNVVKMGFEMRETPEKPAWNWLRSVKSSALGLEPRETHVVSEVKRITGQPPVLFRKENDHG